MGRKSLEELLEEVKASIDSYYDAVIETKRELEEIKTALNNIGYELETGVKERIQEAVEEELKPFLEKMEELYTSLNKLLDKIESRSYYGARLGVKETLEEFSKEINRLTNTLESYAESLRNSIKTIQKKLNSFSEEVSTTVEKNRKALQQQLNIGTNLIALGVGIIVGFFLVGGITWYFFIRPIDTMKEVIGKIPGAKIVIDEVGRWLYVPKETVLFDKKKQQWTLINPDRYDIYILLEEKKKGQR